MKRTILFLFLMLAALLWGETVINGSRSILGAWNAGGAASTIPAKVGTSAPATCTVGEQFFDSNATAGSNILLCTATNTWTAVTSGGGGIELSDVPCLPGDVRHFCLYDDFAVGSATNGQVGALGWQTGGNGTTAAVATTHPNVGALRLSTGATSGHTQWLSLTSSMLGDWYANAARTSDVKFIFRLVNHTDSNFRIVVGQVNVTTGVTSNGFAVGKGSDGDFHLFWGASGEQVSTYDTGVPLDSNWHTVRFYADGTNQKVYITIDDGTPVTACPSGGGCDLTVSAPFSQTNYTLAASVITNTSAARHLDIDYISARGVVGTNAAKRN